MCTSQRHLLPVGIVIAFLLVGCGYNAESKATASPTGVPTPSPTASQSSIILQVGATSYQSGSTVSVMIKNQSQQMISFVDHQTNCTVLLLERQVANSWEPMPPCKLMIATRLHTLNAGGSLEVKLTAPGQWTTGLYRARLDYSFGSRMNNTPTIVYSSEFRVVD